jgi:hypothetical protein
VHQDPPHHLAPETRETEQSFVRAAPILEILMLAMLPAWRGARPMQPARWLKSVGLAVASPRPGECEASVLQPALCSGA